jgi:proteasome lid subunit RPN8/RPN11
MTVRCSKVVAVMVSSAIAMEAMAACKIPARVSGDLAAHPAALKICWSLLEQARWGFSQVEHTAFIVRDSSGTITSVAWPDPGEANIGRWVGAFPVNAIAIVHTHPNWLPTPSFIDAHTAIRTHLPVYVVTRKHIAKTGNGSTTMIVDGDWKPGVVCDGAQ